MIAPSMAIVLVHHHATPAGSATTRPDTGWTCRRRGAHQGDNLARGQHERHTTTSIPVIPT